MGPSPPKLFSFGRRRYDWFACRPAASRRVRRRYIAFVTKGRRKMAATNSAHAQQVKLPFVKTSDRDRIINWWNVKPTGKWVEDFTVGRRYALKFWEVCGSDRAFALEFQQIILGMLSTAKKPKGPTSYSGIEAGFLLAIGELSKGAIHAQTLLQELARVRDAKLPLVRCVMADGSHAPPINPSLTDMGFSWQASHRRQSAHQGRGAARRG